MKKRKKGKAKGPFVQYGALPFRESRSGFEVLLVTTRETRRWIIPKGWPQRGLAPHRAAANEALEEAGVVGKIGKTPIGAYWYDKKLESGPAARCKVRVFPLRVTRQLKKWPEKRQRQVRWHSSAQALRRVRETHLRQIIRAFVKAKRTQT